MSGYVRYVSPTKKKTFFEQVIEQTRQFEIFKWQRKFVRELYAMTKMVICWLPQKEISLNAFDRMLVVD